MGIGGLALAWRRAHLVFGLPVVVSQALAVLAAVLWVVLVLVFTVKWLRYRAEALTELRSPIVLPFFSTPTLSLLIVATAFISIDREIAHVLWWISSVGHLSLTVVLLAALILRKDITLAVLFPAWFIPIVGNVITPLGTPTIGNTTFAWVSFWVGSLSWVALFPLLARRAFFFQPAIPTPMYPLIAIFMAPPAVMMLSWQTLTQTSVTVISAALIGLTWFFMAIVAIELPRLRQAPFGVPYWAYTFPFAAASAATSAFASAWGSELAEGFALGLLLFASVLIGAIAIKTVPAFLAGNLKSPHAPASKAAQVQPSLAEMWEARYAESEKVWSGNPNAVMVDVVQDFPSGRALDLGCGEGADVIWLAEHGWTVHGIDISTTAIQRARSHAEARGVSESTTWQIVDLIDWEPLGEFDLVLATYLHSQVEFDRGSILRKALSVLPVNGVLVVIGHAQFPPWATAHHHDHPDLPTNAEVIKQLQLGPDYQVLIDETRSRLASGPGGITGELTDAILVIRRVSDTDTSLASH